MTRCVRVITVLMLLLTMAPMLANQSVAAQDNGMVNDTTYQSPQFDYTVTWTDDWRARPRDIISNPGGYDTLTLRGENGTLWVQGQGDSVTAAAAVERRIEIEGGQELVSDSDLDAEIPWAEMISGRDKVLIQGDVLESNDAVVVIVLSAREASFDEALADAQEQVQFNGGSILIGEEIVEGTGDGPNGEAAEEATEEATDEPTEEATEEATEEPTEEATEEATEEPTEEATEEVTEEPTEEASEEATEELTEETTEEPVAASGVDGNTYTGPVYGYSLEFDEASWEVHEEYSTESTDGVVLYSDTGSVTFWAYDAYGDDAVACLDGESEYYASEADNVSDWEPMENADGDPIRFEGDTFAWGVFSLTLETTSGNEVELVDYIECQSIPGEDAVLIILSSSRPDDYNDQLDAALDVADTVVFADGTPRSTDGGSSEPQDAEPTDDTSATPDATTNGTGGSGFSGSLFTSPTYGYQYEVPLQWDILSEDLNGNKEIVQLSNGTSQLTLWATDEPLDDLEACVDWAAEESGLTLEVDTNADGDEFRNSGRREAFANFIYTNDDGDDMTYFVSCRWIEQDESVLIIIQDVPYEQFTAERKFRTDIEDTIVIP